jgi:uncharacterized YigZ family protein
VVERATDETVDLRTVVSPVRVQLAPVRGSRFVAELAPARDEAAARAVVHRSRERDPDASHHCWATVLVDGTVRSDDDGEPRDTAGPPILRHLVGAGLSDVVCVVVRWFGGTKLGRGGLVRAYGDAAAAAIDRADVVVRPRTTAFRVAHAYELTGAVEGVLAAFDATEVDSEYDAAVRRTVTVPVSTAAAFTDALVEATAGRVRPTRVTGRAD